MSEADCVNADERAAIVAWLYRLAEEHDDPSLAFLADAIERGEHLMEDAP